MGEESPQLFSTLPSREHDPPNIDLGLDCYSQLHMEPPDGEGERPVSLVSTLSSNSSRDSRSLFGSTIALPYSSTPPMPSGEDIDLELNPAEVHSERADDPSPTFTDSRGRWQERLEPREITNQCNNNNAASYRKALGEIPHITASPVVTDTMAPNPKLTYVDRVVMEIIETERMYVKDLRSIVEDYLAHIIDMSNLPIQPEQVCALFGNIEDIYEFNSELLQSLDMCENDPVAIAGCFVDKREYFEIYTQYCTNYPNSVAALTNCMRSKTLARFFRDRQATLKRSLPLGSFLLKPVQRILKYHLLLQEIAKHFDPDEEGYEVVQEAIDTMTGVAWYINDMKRKHEHAVRVQEIQSLLINWKGPDLTTYGELVLEGTFHVLRAKNTRTLFLFEKMLLITKKRGEHYVYKTHISCSTLMLLDSAKDPLLFSVIHFKHPKQPHTVKAKSVEEKCLWARHIKRLILENHNTIVPQKTKDANVDNSNYLGKYQYSPERLNKAESCQADDFQLGERKGRRRSEPAKQIRRSTKDVLKHADSEGALLGERRSSLQPAASVTTLASSVSEPLQLSPPDAGPELGVSPCKRRLELEEDEEEEDEEEEEEEEEEGESYKENTLMGDDQVADFANSVLAAISCWHYRARALLSTHVTTDDHDRDETEVKADAETHKQAEKHEDESVKDTLTTQVNMEQRCPRDCVPEEKRSDPSEVPSPESPVSRPQQHDEAPTPQDTSTESVEQEEEEEGASDSSCLQVEETSVLTNGEISEEDEEVLHLKSILPLSVLDQASAIAEHFIGGSSRRSSLVSEDLGSLACPSPPAENDVFKSPSACMDLEERSKMLESSTPEPQSTSEVDPSASDPALEALVEGEGRSTLSKQDRLLIHKVRRYYENAGHEDVNFSIKRRESLSYIPAGLVRHLSRKLSSVPQEPTPVHRKGLSRKRPTSWAVFDLPRVDGSQKAHQKTECRRTAETKERSESVRATSTAEEQFRSSAEMLKVWQEMETEEEIQDAQQTEEAEVNETAQDASVDAVDGKTSKQEPRILEESETCTASVNSSVSSPFTISQPPEGRPKPSKTLPLEVANHLNQNHLPKIINFQTNVDEDQILQDMGKMKNKVFQLARQYSQRIKNNRPMVWQRKREMANQQSVKCVPAEEKEQWRRKGKPNLRLPLMGCDHMVIQEVRSPSPVQTPASGTVSQSSITCPQSPQTESFPWPDVQELRSKYVAPTHSCSATHGCSAGTLECCRNMYNGSSHKSSSSTDLHRAPPDRTHCETGPAVEDWPQLQLRPLRCRWGSLDHMSGSLPLHEMPQDRQDPVKSCSAAGKRQELGHFPQEERDRAEMPSVLSSGTMSESNLVRSLRDKFQSLSS